MDCRIITYVSRALFSNTVLTTEVDLKKNINKQSFGRSVFYSKIDSFIFLIFLFCHTRCEIFILSTAITILMSYSCISCLAESCLSLECTFSIPVNAAKRATGYLVIVLGSFVFVLWSLIMNRLWISTFEEKLNKCPSYPVPDPAKRFMCFMSCLDYNF